MIMYIIMTMTMTETVDLETGIDHTIEIDHIVEIYCETTIEMITKIIIGITMKMITETTIEMTIEKKIIGILKNRYIRESIEIIMKIHMKTGTTRIIIEIVIKTKIVIETNIETGTEMTAMTNTGVGLERDTALLRKVNMTTSSRLNKSIKSYNT